MIFVINRNYYFFVFHHNEINRKSLIFIYIAIIERVDVTFEIYLFSNKILLTIKFLFRSKYFLIAMIVELMTILKGIK